MPFFRRMIALIAIPAHCCAAQHIAADDDLGNPEKQPHLIQGNPYTWTPDVPNSIVDRTVAFGSSVILGYSAAEPDAFYQALVTLCSDAGARTATIFIDGKPIGGTVAVPAKSERTVTLIVPREAIADGAFTLEIRHAGTGPNVAVSRVEVRSSSAKPLAARPK